MRARPSPERRPPVLTTAALLAGVLATGCLPAPRTAEPHATPEPGRPSEVTLPEAPPAPADGDAPWRRGLPRPADHPTEISDAPTVFFRGARLLLGDGREIADGHLLLVKGRIAAVGAGAGAPPSEAQVVDARGKTITPGLVDTHSHMGVFPMPAANAHDDGNEATGPVTAGVRTVDAIWPFDPAFQRAVAGGTTTVQVLPGSANLIGGRATTIKLHPAATARELVFPGAPYGLKMACGENPKRVYGAGKRTAPGTRMGNLAGQRAAFLKARKLMSQWTLWAAAERERVAKWRSRAEDAAKKRAKRSAEEASCERFRDPAPCLAAVKKRLGDPPAPIEPFEPHAPPDRDLDAETLAAALEGSVLVHVHCYRSDDMGAMLALGDEVGFRVQSFHHALEAYKIRRELARRGVSVSTWADWFGFKLEANDGIPENLALVHASGGSAIVHTDSPEGVRRLNQEAAKGLWSGRHAGLAIDEAQAIRWITSNPAAALGIDRWVGSLEVGKDADVVVWSGNPFSVYTKAERVYVDGHLRHDANRPGTPWSDFEVQP